MWNYTEEQQFERSTNIFFSLQKGFIHQILNIYYSKVIQMSLEDNMIMIRSHIQNLNVSLLTIEFECQTLNINFEAEFNDTTKKCFLNQLNLTFFSIIFHSFPASIHCQISWFFHIFIQTATFAKNLISIELMLKQPSHLDFWHFVVWKLPNKIFKGEKQIKCGKLYTYLLFTSYSLWL